MSGLVIENLSVQYPTTQSNSHPTLALDKVNLSLAAQSFCVVLGASGCGKRFAQIIQQHRHMRLRRIFHRREQQHIVLLRQRFQTAYGRLLGLAVQFFPKRCVNSSKCACTSA